MTHDQPTIDWIATQHERMIALVILWANINSFSEDLDGLRQMSEALQHEFAKLPGPPSFTEITLEPQKRVDARGNITSLPLGKVLVIRKPAHPSQHRSVLLSGHMDTVYPPDGGFLTCRRIDAQRLLGPGAADLKGGLVVLLLALEAFERSPYAKNLGWEVIINPTDLEQGTTLNLSAIHAGGPVNIVPDLAILRFGLRASSAEAMTTAQKRIHAIVQTAGNLELVEISARPPKIFDVATERFYHQIKSCADMLHLPMRWQESGGVCDGNLLAAERLPTIDTLGPIGGHLHTDQEYVDLG